MTTSALPADPESGYFGPDSVTWRVMADPAAGAGGLSALFVQALHPRAMAGVDQHSDFHTAFWPRLGRTAEYVMTVTSSARERVDAIAAKVRAAHEHVHGVDPVTGQLTTPARPAWTAAATLGFAPQPRWARRMHGLPGLPTTDLAAGLAVRGLRAGVLALPESWRHGPTAREGLARERRDAA